MLALHYMRGSQVLRKDSMFTCPSNPASGETQACPGSSSPPLLSFLEAAQSLAEPLLRFSVVLPLPCLFVSCSAKQLLIQIFTVDKQIPKINRCVLQMSLTKITSLVTRSIRGWSKRMLYTICPPARYNPTPTSGWNTSSQRVERLT